MSNECDRDVPARRRDSGALPRRNRSTPVFARFFIGASALHFARQGGVALTPAQSVAWLVQLVVFALACWVGL